MNDIIKAFTDILQHNPQIIEAYNAGRLTLADAVSMTARGAVDATESEAAKAERSELAERVYNIDIYEAMNNDATPADIENTIQNNPETIIYFLLDKLEDL